MTEIPRCFSISIQSEGGSLLNLIVLDGTCYLDLSTKEEELFGEGRLTGVRV